VDILSVVLIILLAATFLFIAWFLTRPRSADPSVVLLQEQVDRLRTQLGESLSGSRATSAISSAA
jgi:hypothetical protein